jgi:hypothetical protein
MRAIMKFIPSAFWISALLFCPPARADGAYHWKDSQGRDHYGSNPPRDAVQVESLSGKRVSRYSSEKLLKPFHGMTVSETDIINKFPVDKTHSIAPSGRTKLPPAPADSPVSEQTLLPELQQGELSVKHDAQKRVTSCSVVVANKASIPAQNVLVSFEFSDGTLVPGVGPESIDADSSAKYSIPDEMLPIAVSSSNPAEKDGPRPKVSIKAGVE